MNEASSRPRPRDPTSPLLRWSIMLAAGLMLFGSYFAYDSIAALSQLLIDQEGYTRAQVGLMESLYSWPNIVAVLFTGILVDKFGTRVMSFILSGLVVLGAVLVAIAPGLSLILIGRAVLGIGVESLLVCQSTILYKWFKQDDLALSFGFALVFLRLGSIASQSLGTVVANRYGGISAALWLAVIVCVFSLACAVFYVVLEKAAEGKVELVAPKSDKLALADILRFDSRFWYILIFATVCYGGIFPFRALAQDFFHDKWGIAPELGAMLVSILPYSSLILALIIGRAVDRKGRRVSLLLCGAVLMVLAHLCMGLSSLHPVYPMIVLGLSFSLISATLWPTVPLVVDAKIVGTAFGLIFMIQNIGLAAFPVLNGALRDATHSYVSSQLMFAGLGVVGLIVAVLLLRADRNKGNVLETKVMDLAGS